MTDIAAGTPGEAAGAAEARRVATGGGRRGAASVAAGIQRGAAGVAAGPPVPSVEADPSSTRHPGDPPPGAVPVARDAGFLEVARVAEIPPGWAMTVRAGSRPIAVANCDGDFKAFENACPHAGGPLGDSRLKDGCLVCPWHDSAFDAGTGSVVRGPSRKPVKAYALRVTNGVIWVHPGALSPPAPGTE